LEEGEEDRAGVDGTEGVDYGGEGYKSHSYPPFIQLFYSRPFQLLTERPFEAHDHAEGAPLEAEFGDVGGHGGAEVGEGLFYEAVEGEVDEEAFDLFLAANEKQQLFDGGFAAAPEVLPLEQAHLQLAPLLRLQTLLPFVGLGGPVGLVDFERRENGQIAVHCVTVCLLFLKNLLDFILHFVILIIPIN
jgi:hypothetical protein